MKKTPAWLRRGAWATAVVTFLLLTAGGVVTSRDAGLVFADWPLSNGSANPDGWLLDPDQRAEHGHRILGAMAGLLAVLVVVWTWRTERRRSVRWLSVAVLAGFCLQGLLGGLRVTEQSGLLALIHGCSGQLLFALVVGLAYLLSPDGTREHGKTLRTRPLFVAGGATVFAIFMQVILGAHLRHHGGPAQPHILGAVFVTISVLWTVTIVILREPERGALRRNALLMLALVCAQVVLGIGALGAVSGQARSVHTTYGVWAPTLHQACGALLLAAAVVFTLRAARRSVSRSFSLAGVDV